jgi:hypothetical protein
MRRRRRRTSEEARTAYEGLVSFYKDMTNV